MNAQLNHSHSYQVVDARRFKLTTALLGILLLTTMVILLLAAGSVAAAEEAIPVARFINPQGGQSVSNTVDVMVFDPDGRQSVELSVDGGAWQAMNDNRNGTHSLKWNTATVGNGKHTLSARLRYGAGGGDGPELILSINVTVSNSIPDGQATGPAQMLAAGGLPDPCSSGDGMSQAPCLPPTSGRIPSTG